MTGMVPSGLGHPPFVVGSQLTVPSPSGSVGDPSFPQAPSTRSSRSRPGIRSLRDIWNLPETHCGVSSCPRTRDRPVVGLQLGVAGGKEGAEVGRGGRPKCYREMRVLKTAV